MRLFIRLLFLCAVFLCTSILQVFAQDGDATNLMPVDLMPIDAVLVLDVSYSMVTADPGRIANEAMHMFIERLELQRDRVAVIAYAGHVTYNSGLVLVTPYTLPYLQESIHSLGYASWTDHSLGLLAALEALYTGIDVDIPRQQSIIFFTDGNLSLSSFSARTISQAEEDKLNAIALAQERDVVVYSIGLNTDGTLDRRHTEAIAYATGGLPFEAMVAEELPYILDRIFSLMIAATSTYEPTDYIVYDNEKYTCEPIICYEGYETIYKSTLKQDANDASFWYFFATLVAAVVATLATLLVALLRRNKRVFTGTLTISITGADKIIPPYSVNLIEYGRVTNLAELVGYLHPDAGHVAIYPSSKAPSHMPKIIFKCKKKSLNFAIDYISINAVKGIAIGSGTEMQITCVKSELTIRLVY